MVLLQSGPQLQCHVYMSVCWGQVGQSPFKWSCYSPDLSCSVMCMCLYVGDRLIGVRSSGHPTIWTITVCVCWRQVGWSPPRWFCYNLDINCSVMCTCLYVGDRLVGVHSRGHATVWTLYVVSQMCMYLYVGDRLVGVHSSGHATIWTLAVVSCVCVCMSVQVTVLTVCILECCVIQCMYTGNRLAGVHSSGRATIW